MSITVEIKSVYGRETIYPVCKAAQEFASIAKQQTLTRREIDAIKRLGYAVNVKQGAATL